MPPEASKRRPGWAGTLAWLIKMTLIPDRFDIPGLIKNSLSGVNIGSSERFYDILYRLFFFNYWGGEGWGAAKC